MGRKILFVTTDQQRYDSLGCEGELYDLRNDPLQWENLWDDPDSRQLKADLMAASFDSPVLLTTDVGSRRIAPM